MRNNTQDRYLIPLGATTAFMAVGLGAFGTHALKERISPDMLAIWHTGVEYHFGHALAAVVAGLALRLVGHRSIRWAGWLFLVGLAIFSGSLYLLATTAAREWGAVTPIGGLCFLAGWLLFAIGAAKAPEGEPGQGERSPS